MAKVEVYLGDGTGPQELEVAYVGQFPRDTEGSCAFCHGDPCAENPDAEGTPIGQYYARNKHAHTCPVCDGRPS